MCTNSTWNPSILSCPQDKLMDLLFGDLVLQGKLCKIMDNIYFGGDTLLDLSTIFKEVMTIIKQADQRVKPSKVKIHIKSANILGLLWQRGTLTLSCHKLDPLAYCDKPKTVKGVHSFLGGVCFNKICLNGAKLASASRLLDQETPSNRSERDKINWTPDLMQSFREIQVILKDSQTVTIPREGDNLILAIDACSSIPAGGSKLIIQHPRVPGYLPSFNFGCRLPIRLKTTFTLCEFEAYVLNNSIKRAEYFIHVSRNPGVCLTDSKAIYQAKQKLDRRKFSSNCRLQDFLANISAKRMKVQHISAKLPSPL